MKRHIVLLFLCLLSLPYIGFSMPGKRKNKSSYFRFAEKEYAAKRYSYAIPFYKKYLSQKDSKDSIALLHLAEAYWSVKNYDSAFEYYHRFELSNVVPFETAARIAELLANRKDYQRASEIYKKMIGASLQKTKGDWIAERYRGFSNPDKFVKDSLDYTIHLLQLNTKQQDFSPQMLKGGLVFISNRYSEQFYRGEFGWDGLPFAGLYHVKDTADLFVVADTAMNYHSINGNTAGIRANDDYTESTSNDNNIIVMNHTRKATVQHFNNIEKFSNQLDAKYNYGPFCFNGSGNKIYYTRNSLRPNNGVYHLEICESDLRNGKWSTGRVLSFIEPESDFFHPALSKDEKRLYFCSNRPGGFGGSDIYYVNLSSLEQLVINHLDYHINTEGNELFPTMNGDTLYFSSDGLAGLGGLDIYKTWMNDGKWVKPENAGYPVNSSYDDFGMVFKTGNSAGYFASNRLGTDDIYSFNYQYYTRPLSGSVLNKATGLRMPGVTVSLFSVSDGIAVKGPAVKTDITGNYAFSIRPGIQYKILFCGDGIYEDSLQVTQHANDTKIEMSPVFISVKQTENQVQPKDSDGDGVPDAADKCPGIKGLKEFNGCPDVQKSINELSKVISFANASAALQPAAIPALDTLTSLLLEYPGLTLQIEGHTDNKAGADYNKQLSQKRADAVKLFFVKKGIAENRFTAKGYGLEKPIASNLTEAGRALNRRVIMVASFK